MRKRVLNLGFAVGTRERMPFRSRVGPWKTFVMQINIRNANRLPSIRPSGRAVDDEPEGHAFTRATNQPRQRRSRSAEGLPFRISLSPVAAQTLNHA
jgi:hypothetical protein